MQLTIDRDHPDPVYEQIASQLRQLIATGALSSGATLPSVRQLAGDLGVNLNTVARGYRLLEAEGFLSIRDRAGVTVAPPAPEVEPAARAQLLQQIRSTLARLKQAGMPLDELLGLLRREVEALDPTSKEAADEW